MNLSTITADALDMTLRLEAALHLDDLELCRDLMELRAVVMDQFECCHRQSSPRDQQICQAQIQELFEADAQLQSSADSALNTAATEFRKSVAGAGGGSGSAYSTVSTQACVDRKA